MTLAPGSTSTAAADSDGLAGAGPGTRIGRFRLDDLITRDAAGSVWRSTDERLRRRVTLRIVLPHDPRRSEIRRAACRAARVDDTHLARVLDVLDIDGALVIVSEWLEARTLSELLTQPLPASTSIGIATGVARAVSALAAHGVAHGRITAGTVLISADGMVRLRGHAIGAALWGPEVAGDPAAADIFGIGAVLMACLTGRWPTGPRDDLPAVPVIGRNLASPGRLVADVPPRLDAITMRCLAAAPCPRGGSPAEPFATPAAVISALALAQHEVNLAEPATVPNHGSRLARRLGATVLAVASVCAMAAVGMALVVASTPTESVASERGESSNEAWKPPPTPAALEPEVRKLPTEIRIPIKRAWSIGGNRAGKATRTGTGTGAEPAASGPGAAFDEDVTSAWRTASFRKPAAPGAAGTALVVDLGSERSVQAMDVGLLGASTDIRVSAAQRPPNSSADLQVLATLEGATPLTVVRLPRPVRTRYLAIQFVRLPLTATGYRGGISDLSIRGLAD